MKLLPVKSSNILAIGHDVDKNELHVQFKSGGTFIYSGVDHAAYTLMCKAESVGGHFHAHIKNKYNGRKAEE